MPIKVKTQDITGTFQTDDINAVAQALNSPDPMISIGADFMCVKDDVQSFYSGEPADDAANTFKVNTRSGDEFVISLPEGEDATTLSQKVNAHAAGETDRFGNRIVRAPFIVLGDENAAVGLRFNDVKSAVRVSRTPGGQEVPKAAAATAAKK